MPSNRTVTTVLACICGKRVEGQVEGDLSWERMANLAEQNRWLPVVKGEAVGMSAGTHFYACCPEHQKQWLSSL